MHFLNAMQNRYTTKQYDANKQLTSDKVEALKEILRLSPSSINSQPWQFTFVSDPAVKNKLSEASFHNKEKVQACDTVVVFKRINNVEQFEKELLAKLPEGAQGYYQQHLKPLDEKQIKAWFERQVYLSLGVFLSACANMEIDATPMEGIAPTDYDTILGQTDYTTVVAVAIGCRDQNDFNQPSKNPKTRRDLQQVITTI